MLRRLAALRARFPNLYSRLEGLQVREGWDALVTRLSAKLEALILQQPEDQRARYYAVAVKPKFGVLRFYLEEATPAMTAIIQEAQRESTTTCEICGEPGTTKAPLQFGPTLTICGTCTGQLLMDAAQDL